MARRPGYDLCPCGKRGYAEHNVDRALGRARAKRRRISDARGTRRGVKIERRTYECSYGGHHLTEMSARKYHEITVNA